MQWKIVVILFMSAADIILGQGTNKWKDQAFCKAAQTISCNPKPRGFSICMKIQLGWCRESRPKSDQFKDEICKEAVSSCQNELLSNDFCNEARNWCDYKGNNICDADSDSSTQLDFCQTAARECYCKRSSIDLQFCAESFVLCADNKTDEDLFEQTNEDDEFTIELFSTAVANQVSCEAGYSLKEVEVRSDQLEQKCVLNKFARYNARVLGRFKKLWQ